MISKEKILKLYVQKGKSAKEAGKFLGVSESTFSYWMRKHSISRRTISDAIYKKNNPHGDPFAFKSPKTIQEGILFGLGVGLYWGEGTKANKNSVRLGNSDPDLLSTFIKFLEVCCGVNKGNLQFGLQIFNDISEKEALGFWTTKLHVSKEQFYKATISKSVSRGTYRKKAQYGVVTIHFHNTKLRNILVGLLPYKDF